MNQGPETGSAMDRAADLSARKMAQVYAKQDVERLFGTTAHPVRDQSSVLRRRRYHDIMRRDRIATWNEEKAEKQVAQTQWRHERARQLLAYEQTQDEVQAAHRQATAQKTAEMVQGRADRARENHFHEVVMAELHAGVSSSLGLPVDDHWMPRVTLNPGPYINDPLAHLHRLTGE